MKPTIGYVLEISWTEQIYLWKINFIVNNLNRTVYEQP